MNTARCILVYAVAALPATGFAQTQIEGHIIGGNGKPLRGAEIRIEAHDGKIQGFLVKTNEDGEFKVPILPVEDYRFTIRVNGIDEFVANHIRTHRGDPWRIEYNMKFGLATMSTAHSKSIRRFAWQGKELGSNIEGGWVETTNPTGYRPPTSNVSNGGADTIRAIQAQSGNGVGKQGM